MQERPDLLPPALENALYLLGLSGIAALFLPFTSNISPWDVTGDQVFRSGYIVQWSELDWSLFLLGVPFLLAVPISAAPLLQILAKRLSRPHWIAAYCLALAATASTILYCARGVAHAGISGRVAAIIVPVLVTLMGGVTLLIRSARLGLPHPLNSIVAMEVAYVAGVLLPLIGFFGVWQIGAYVTLIAIIVYAGHVVAIELIVRGARASSRL
jgi:hypothetical protein